MRPQRRGAVVELSAGLATLRLGLSFLRKYHVESLELHVFLSSFPRADLLVPGQVLSPENEFLAVDALLGMAPPHCMRALLHSGELAHPRGLPLQQHLWAVLPPAMGVQSSFG